MMSNINIRLVLFLLIAVTILPRTCTGDRVCPDTGYIENISKSGKKLCLCAPGYGSSVPKWKTSQYPTIAPSCYAFIPGKHTEYDPNNSTFLPPGRGKGQCFCFPCPASHTSKGGPLNAAGAQCTAIKPTVFYVQLTIRTTGQACNAAVTAAVQAALANSLKGMAGVDAASVTAETASCGAVASPLSSYQLAIKLSYIGRWAARTTMVKAINANHATGICTYGVCDAIRTASGSRAALSRASAGLSPFPAPPPLPSPTPKPSPSPKPSGCGSNADCTEQPCMEGVCSRATGNCSYTAPQPDDAPCREGLASGRCSAGACRWLASNVDEMSEGVARAVLFTARLAKGPVFVQLSLYETDDAGVRSGIALGDLYDDGRIEHADDVAGDGIFSNTIRIEFATLGDSYYVATYGDVTVGTVSIKTVAGPTAERVKASTVFVNNAQRIVNELVTSGTEPEAAMDYLEDLLRAGSLGPKSSSTLPSAETVSPGTVSRLSETAITFYTTDGIPCILMAPVEGTYSGSSSSSSSGSRSDSSGSRSRKELGNAPPAEQQQQAGQDSSSSQNEFPSTWLPGQTVGQTGQTVGQTQWSMQEHPFMVTASQSRKLLQGTGQQEEGICPTWDQKRALIIAPFFDQTRKYDDSPTEIQQLYLNSGFNVIFKCSSQDDCFWGSAQLTDFTRWSSFSVVVVNTHGTSDASGENAVIASHAQISTKFVPDLFEQPPLLYNGGTQYGGVLTPKWFEKYAPVTPAYKGMAGTVVVHFGVCRSGKGKAPAFAEVFRKLGVSSFIGYSENVQCSYAGTQGLRFLGQLLNDDPISKYTYRPPVDKYGAQFTPFNYHPETSLSTRCDPMCAPVNCGCRSPSICSPRTGTCTGTSLLPEGGVCVLEEDPTPPYDRTYGVCLQGACVADPCEGANCQSPGVCQVSTCNPNSVFGGGPRCVVGLAPDSTECTAPDGTNGACQGGLCKDLCLGVTCTPSSCQTESTCDIASGDCVTVNKPEGELCFMDDGSNNNGTCWNGDCLINQR